jgi:hypothetical protein
MNDRIPLVASAQIAIDDMSGNFGFDSEFKAGEMAPAIASA